VAGFHNPTMDTVGLSGWGEPGPGRFVTIFVKPTALKPTPSCASGLM
jgi:hypothetical protein